MAIFKNKNPEKIRHLNNCSSDLKNNADYVIAAIKKFGSQELSNAAPHLPTDAQFLLKLIGEIPEAAAIIPDVVVDRYLDRETNEIVEHEMNGKEFALFVHCVNHSNIYKHMKPEHALEVREFENQGSGYAINFGGDAYKFTPIYFVRYINEKPDPKYHEKGLAERSTYIAKLDELRPDVKKLAQERVEGTESVS